ncbi:MAG: ABC transporter permease DevC [Leptolyngbyaceae cyanobacterium MAG.088]|nr:ABC transporter permease DevC [Leptolyngbyaceae cyanobacterium MAG.088]
MFKRLPVAWLNLTHKPSRLLLSLGGIVFAAVLMFMFTGFKHALYDSQIRLIEQLNGEVFLINSRRSNMVAPVQFSSELLYQAKTYPGVSSVHPVYLGKAFWRKPDGTTAKTVRLIAFNPDEPIFRFPEIEQYRTSLHLPDTVLVDSRARTEIGRRQSGTVTELGDRQVKVLGNFELGNDFATFNGNLITSEENFLRYQTLRDAKQTARSLDFVDIGVIFLNSQVSLEQAITEIRKMLPETVSVYTQQELINWELNVWQNESNIGFIFGILTFMGFVIGIVLCYQILYSDITDNIKAYATVKAIGYNNGYLSTIVLQQAILLAVLGFIPSIVCSYFLYQFAISFTGLIFKMTFERTGFIFLMTILMCIFSGFISALKVQQCDPADIF